MELSSTRTGRRTIICIIVAAIAAMGISLWIGLQQSVWFDESYSVLVAQQAPGKIIELVASDVHPPVYYLLLHAWGGLFGWGPVALRLLSVLGLGGSVIVAGILVRRLFGNRAAVISAIIIAFSPLLLRYGFEIRMYSLASFIGILATYIMVRARDTDKYAFWLWLTYAILVALGMLTLYQLALLWVAHLAWLLYVDRGKLRHIWDRPWVRAYIAAATFFLPWLPRLLGQLGNGALANIGQPMGLEQLLGVLSFNSFYQPLWQLGALQSIILLFLIVLGVRGFIRAYQQKKFRESLLLVTAYIAIPIALFMIVSLVRPSYVERYLSHVAIGLMILIGLLVAWGTSTYSRRKRLLVYVLGVGVLGIGIYNLSTVGNFNFQRMQKPDVATVARSIDCTDATVVAADPYVATELSYYVSPTCDVRFYSEWQKMGGGYAPLSDSPQRLSTTNIPRLTDKLYYVYYDEPKLQVPSLYRRTSAEMNGGMTVAQYEAAT